VAGDMRPGNPEVAEERTAIGGLLGYRERDTGTATARKATAVIGDHAIVVGKAGLGQQREEAIREDATMDQQQWLPRAVHVIFKVHTIEVDTLHWFSPLPLRAVTRADIYVPSRHL
jgi:hypothetical protein